LLQQEDGKMEEGAIIMGNVDADAGAVADAVGGTGIILFTNFRFKFRVVYRV